MNFRQTERPFMPLPDPQFPICSLLGLLVSLAALAAVPLIMVWPV